MRGGPAKSKSGLYWRALKRSLTRIYVGVELNHHYFTPTAEAEPSAILFLCADLTERGREIRREEGRDGGSKGGRERVMASLGVRGFLELHNLSIEEGFLLDFFGFFCIVFILLFVPHFVVRPGCSNERRQKC